VGYARVLTFFLLLLRIRKVDVALRRERIQELTEKRREILELNQKLKEEKEAALEQARAEQGESFNEEEFHKEYDEGHPLAEVPEEVQEEEDNDI
jgi:hypothetical protein